jgi:hypothetical protein
VAALSYDESPNVMIVGVGLMGQYLASHVGEWLGAARLVLVDGADAINVGGERTALADFARTRASRSLRKPSMSRVKTPSPPCSRATATSAISSIPPASRPGR